MAFGWRRIKLDPGTLVLRYRLPIALLLGTISLFMAYGASRIQMAARFIDFFPSVHRNVELYHEFSSGFGGAQTLTFMIRVRNGDIFNYLTLKRITEINTAVDRLPGVEHQSLRSLASYRVSYAEAEQGALLTKTYMYPNTPTTPEEIIALKQVVLAHKPELKGLVSQDNRSTIVTATFSEFNLDYKELFYKIQDIVDRYQDADHEIDVAGEPLVRGYGYHYLPTIALILGISIVAMLSALYFALRSRSTWWAPILTGSLSALWGMGFIGWMGYNFDPVMLVIPLILTARDLSHGIQWQGRYYDELDRIGQKYAACVATTNLMLPPGFLSIVVDIAGIIFVSFGGIPVLTHIGLGGAVWLAGSITMVFIFQPIVMSYLPTPRIIKNVSPEAVRFRRLRRMVDALVEMPTTPGLLRGTLLAATVVFIIIGVMSGANTEIGYSSVGTPLYRPSSKVNRDIAAISQSFPTDEGWVAVVTADRFPLENSALNPQVIRMTDDLRHFLLLRNPDVVEVISLASTIQKPINQVFHDDFPKYYALPKNSQASGNLWHLFFAGTAPGEAERWGDNIGTLLCVRILLRSHTFAALTRLQKQIEEFKRTRVMSDPSLATVQFRYLGGGAGLYAAANDILFRLDLINIVFVLSVVFLFSAISFQSFVAGLLFVLACVLANFAAFIYMRARDIGLTIDTIPVISLGIGLGIDYGIYTVARIRDEVMGGNSIDTSVEIAIRSTGSAVFTTFVVIVGAIIPWAFSPMLFHNSMSVLLTFLMCTNMIAGVLILPAYIAWAHPRFIRCYEVAQKTKVPLYGV
jgi:predicted RND superfamily exporter protein